MTPLSVPGRRAGGEVHERTAGERLEAAGVADDARVLVHVHAVGAFGGAGRTSQQPLPVTVLAGGAEPEGKGQRVRQAQRVRSGDRHGAAAVARQRATHDAFHRLWRVPGKPPGLRLQALPRELQPLPADAGVAVQPEDRLHLLRLEAGQKSMAPE